MVEVGKPEELGRRAAIIGRLGAGLADRRGSAVETFEAAATVVIAGNHPSLQLTHSFPFLC